MEKELKALKEELAILRRCLAAEQELNRKLNEELMEAKLNAKLPTVSEKRRF